MHFWFPSLCADVSYFLHAGYWFPCCLTSPCLIPRCSCILSEYERVQSKKTRTMGLDGKEVPPCAHKEQCLDTRQPCTVEPRLTATLLIWPPCYLTATLSWPKQKLIHPLNMATPLLRQFSLARRCPYYEVPRTEYYLIENCLALIYQAFQNFVSMATGCPKLN